MGESQSSTKEGRLTSGLDCFLGSMRDTAIYRQATNTWKVEQGALASNIGRMGEGGTMLKPKRPRLNIQREDARLKKTAAELIQLARKFAPKWNRITNDGKMTVEPFNGTISPSSQRTGKPHK